MKDAEMRQQNLFYDEDDIFGRLCSLKALSEGFKAVKKNHGSPGIDGITIEEFESRLEQELNSLKEELESWRYNPQPSACWTWQKTEPLWRSMRTDRPFRYLQISPVPDPVKPA